MGGRRPIAATHIPRRIATTTTTWSGLRTRGATIGTVEAFAIIIATRLTIATQPWVIDCVAAKCSRIVLRSSSLEKAVRRHPNLRLRQLQPSLPPRRLLPARLPPLLLRQSQSQSKLKCPHQLQLQLL